jgi:hypothetical protein
MAMLTCLVLGDQHRFQAWIYQFGMVALFLTSLPANAALTLSRWWFVSTYAYSGLSKLDASFCGELGLRFLETLCRPLGLDCMGWPAIFRSAAILVMPGWELLVAMALSVPGTWRLGRAGALVLHGSLLAILGPAGMGHSPIVLVWNIAMLLEVWIAFGVRRQLAPGDLPQPSSAQGWLARGAFLCGVLLPLGERWGYCDAWPAHALYASHVERTEVYLHEDDLDAYPREVLRHLGPPGAGSWRRLDLTSWSRAERGVPVYPQARACNGLAEALALQYGDQRLIRVVQWGRADRWSGRRSQTQLLGLDEIRRWANQYCLNAHPE